MGLNVQIQYLEKRVGCLEETVENLLERAEALEEDKGREDE